MNVLLLNWRDIHNPLAGGAEVHVHEIFTRAVKRGWRVSALTAWFQGCSAQENCDGVEVHRCGGPHSYPLAVPHAYWTICKELKPDLVVDFINKLPLYSPLYVRRPLCAFVHHLFGTAARAELGTLAALPLRTFEAAIPLVYRKVPIIVGSHSAAAELRCLGFGNQTIHVVPYGVDTDRYKPSNKSSRPSVVFVGRLKKYKGIQHLLNASACLAQKIPEIEVHIAGQGDYEPVLRGLATRLGIEDRVHFHGYVLESEKVRLYQQAWVSCFPSVKEGFGITVAEAALCGTPTVGFEVPGLRDSITHDETGLLVPYCDIEALGAALERVIVDQTLRQRLAHAGQQRFSDFTWDLAADATLSLLERLSRRQAGRA